MTRNLAGMVDTDWPVLMSLSNKDFVGETLAVPLGERLVGTWRPPPSALAGRSALRVHEVPQTRQTSTWWQRRWDIRAAGGGSRPA